MRKHSYQFFSSKDEVRMFRDFPSGSLVRNPLANTGDAGLIPGSGRSPGEANENSLKYSCLGNPTGQSSLVGYSLWVCKESDMT